MVNDCPPRGRSSSKIPHGVGLPFDLSVYPGPWDQCKNLAAAGDFKSRLKNFLRRKNAEKYFVFVGCNFIVCRFRICAPKELSAVGTNSGGCPSSPWSCAADATGCLASTLRFVSG